MTKKFFAFSSLDFDFLQTAVSPYPPPSEGNWDFVQHGSVFIPNDISATDPASADWIKQKEQHIKHFQSTGVFSPKDNFLSSFLKEYTFIAMNNHACSVAQQCNLPYVTPDYFFSEDEFSKVKVKSHLMLKKISKGIDPLKMNWSANWIAYHANFIRFLLDAYCFAEAIAEAFNNSDNELLCLCDVNANFGNHLPDNFAPNIWKSLLPGVRIIAYSKKSKPDQVISTQHIDYSKMKGAVIVCSTGPISYRFYPMILSLEEQINKNIIIALTERSYVPSELSLKMLNNEKLSLSNANFTILPYPELYKPEEHVESQLYCKKQLHSLFGWKDDISESGSRYITRFFTGIESVYKQLIQIWQNYPPLLCMAECNVAAENAVPLITAQRLGIPTIGLPHSYALGVRIPEGLVPCDKYMVTNYSSELSVKKIMGSQAQVTSFPQVNMDNEYPADNSDHLWGANSEKCNILVILTSSIMGTPLVINKHRHSLLEWLAEINNVPQQMKDKISVKVKLHPRFTDFSICKAANIKIDQILPPNSELGGVLKNTNIAITCNYLGAPSAHAARMGVPVIHCFSPSELHHAKILDSYFPLIKTGCLVTEHKKIWSNIYKLINDAEYRNSIIQEQLAYTRTFLMPTRNDFIEWVESAMGR